MRMCEGAGVGGRGVKKLLELPAKHIPSNVASQLALHASERAKYTTTHSMSMITDTSCPPRP